MGAPTGGRKLPPVFVKDSFGNRYTQTRAVGLGGVKGVKKSLGRPHREPGAIVTYRHLQGCWSGELRIRVLDLDLNGILARGKSVFE